MQSRGELGSALTLREASVVNTHSRDPAMPIGRKTRVTADETASFKTHGYVILRDVLSSDEVAPLKRWVEEIGRYPETPGKYMIYYEDSVVEQGRSGRMRRRSNAPRAGDFGLIQPAAAITSMATVTQPVRPCSCRSFPARVRNRAESSPASLGSSARGGHRPISGCR